MSVEPKKRTATVHVVGDAWASVEWRSDLRDVVRFSIAGCHGSFARGELLEVATVFKDMHDWLVRVAQHEESALREEAIRVDKALENKKKRGTK